MLCGKEQVYTAGWFALAVSQNNTLPQIFWEALNYDEAALFPWVHVSVCLFRHKSVLTNWLLQADLLTRSSGDCFFFFTWVKHYVLSFRCILLNKRRLFFKWLHDFNLKLLHIYIIRQFEGLVLHLHRPVSFILETKLNLSSESNQIIWIFLEKKDISTNILFYITAF